MPRVTQRKGVPCCRRHKCGGGRRLAYIVAATPAQGFASTPASNRRRGRQRQTPHWEAVSDLLLPSLLSLPPLSSLPRLSSDPSSYLLPPPFLMLPPSFVPPPSLVTSSPAPTSQSLFPAHKRHRRARDPIARRRRGCQTLPARRAAVCVLFLLLLLRLGLSLAPRELARGASQWRRRRVAYLLLKFGERVLRLLGRGGETGV